MSLLSRFALLAMSTAPLCSQQLIETFSLPNGPVFGWTSRTTNTSAAWSVSNGRVVKTGGGTADYLTRDGLSAKNCVIDLEVFYGTSGVQYGGLVARHPGTPSPNPSVYCKIQDNGGAADLDRCFIYENGVAGNVYADLGAGITSAIIRMVMLDNQCTMLIDKDKNGTFDQSFVKPISGALAAGMVGLTAYTSSQLDNFKFYDGVLAESAATPPKVGTTYNVRFATPAAQFTPWVAAFSLTNGGIPLDPARALPLAVDPLFNLTLGNAGPLGLAGIIDANGDGKLAFPIPNNPALVGFAFFAGAVTLDPAKPFAIGTISQDLRVVIQA